MTVEEKINILVERYCRNRSHLADLIEFSPQAVNNWVYRNRIPRSGIKAILARFPQIDPDWLRGGSMPFSSGPLPLPDEEDTDEETLNFGTKPDSEPKAEKLHAGSKSHFPSQEDKGGLIPLQMPRHDVKYVFQCHGDSMLPRIQDGDYVGVSEALGRYENFRKGDLYLVQTTDGRLMVKMVEDPGPTIPHLLLSTENTNYQMADGGRLPKNEVYAVYRVIMVMRDI